MRDPRLKTKTPTCGGPGFSRNAVSVCKSFLAKFRRPVNEIRIAGLLFGRDLMLAGLACLGWPWSRRLSLWIDALDHAAEELRERQGVRL